MYTACLRKWEGITGLEFRVEAREPISVLTMELYENHWFSQILTLSYTNPIQVTHSAFVIYYCSLCENEDMESMTMQLSGDVTSEFVSHEI